MARVLPFRGVRYNPDTVTDPDSVLAPPYDIISPEEKERLHGRSPHNIIHIDFGRVLPGDSPTGNRYTRAARFLEEWLASGVFLRDAEPAFYAYEVVYTISGRENRFRGFLGQVGIEPFEAGVVLPHEETHSKPKSDRLELMRATHANVSPIFSLYDSKDGVTSAILDRISIGPIPPVMEGRDKTGAIHRLWRIDGTEDVRAISREMADRKIFIADGHHRYETALHYMHEAGDKNPGAGYVMMFLANMEDTGLTILPTHRLIKKTPADLIERLSRVCRVEREEIEKSSTGWLDGVAGSAGHRFGLYLGKGVGYLIEIDPAGVDDPTDPLSSLDVTVLHKKIMGEILGVEKFCYEMDPVRVMTEVDSGTHEAAFFLNPTRLTDLRDVALAGKRMPPKSTYFYPKLLTGLVLNLLDR